MKALLWAGFALGALMPGLGFAQGGPCEAPVATEAGVLRGVEDDGACAWLGIPYAEPPVGERRWRPPASVEPWEGIRDAQGFAPRCAQKGIMETINFDPSHERSEDCLYLNAWRPRQVEGPLPVMVFFHGGGLFGGTANTPMYHGHGLAQGGDVLVVTVNYRLAIFGFLATEGLVEEDPNGSAGNYGLLDQVAALKWVQANAAALGGDPERVTIFGESAGGWSVCNLMASPLAEGLFHGAIMQSGGCRAVTSMERGVAYGATVSEHLGCDAKDPDCLRGLSTRAGRRPQRG